MKHSEAKVPSENKKVGYHFHHHILFYRDQKDSNYFARKAKAQPQQCGRETRKLSSF